MQYRDNTLGHLVEAVQYLGNPFEVFNWLLKVQGGETVQFTYGDGQLVFPSGVAKRGSFLVLYENAVHVYTPAEFHARYSRACSAQT